MSNLHLTIFPNKLKICSIPLKSVCYYTHLMLKLLVKPTFNKLENNGNDDENFIRNQSHFFSVTQTPHEISVITTLKYANKLLKVNVPDDELKIKIWPQNWRAIRLDQGNIKPSVVNSVSSKLSENNITIFYVSTFDSDYCLVQSVHIKNTISILNGVFSILTDEPDTFESENSLTEDEIDIEENENIEDDISDNNEEKLTVYLLDYSFQLIGINTEDLSSIIVPLIQLLFYSSKNNNCNNKESKTAIPFISFTQVQDEISLLIEDRFFNFLPSNLFQCYNEIFNTLRVGNENVDLGYSVCGIVSKLSTPLAARGINIFYLSTYKTDYCMVLASDTNEIIECAEYDAIKLKISER
eukprot:TRINITY_DN84_c0_g2_i2.p1 TRINITY_DN84_c0_g2~~TRINITY_DN84_c0_g2_i2.p1  ORF type:complete len:355 (-),score=76.32 TRINITY_DN84_c0_g2_i2:315-1379(-)